MVQLMKCKKTKVVRAVATEKPHLVDVETVPSSNKRQKGLHDDFVIPLQNSAVHEADFHLSKV